MPVDRSGHRFPFSAADRLHEADEFTRLLKTRPVTIGRFDVFRLSAGLSHPRLGLIISKRFLKKAVDRNTLKRHLREGFRCLAPELVPWDFVVRLRSRKRIPSSEVTTLRQEARRLFAALPRRPVEKG